MAIAQAPLLAPTAGAPSAHRDTGIDLVRAFCITAVVLLHAIMVGVTIGDVGPVFANASEGAWWIVPVSWMLQVMPLFFIIGGFSGFLAHHRARQRGATASAFVAGRVHRLLRPAVITIAVAGASLALLLAAGVGADLVATAGFRYGQPLWFLGVFLLCQALLPAMSALHRRAPLRTVGLLVAAALCVDAVRGATGLDAVGFVNLGFVWLALQQLGFFLADGTVDALSRRTRAVVGIAALAALVVTTATGVYSPDLIESINPPTGVLLLVGAVHLSALSLVRGPLTALSARPAAAAFSSFVNRRAMTVYLWHMPVLLAMAGMSALLALAGWMHLPALGSAAWWLGRPLWLVAALLFTALVAVVFAKAETAAPSLTALAPGRVARAVAIGAAGVVLLLVAGTTPLTAAVAVTTGVIALRLASAPTSSPSQRPVGLSPVVA